MKDYTITVKRNNQKICSVGGCNMNYDNVIWWQLNKLVEIVQSGFETKDDLISKIENGTEYFHEDNDLPNNDAPILNLDSKTIEVPFIPVYRPEEVSKEECCIDLKIRDGEYYSVYDDDEEYKMEKVEFDDVELLRKRTMSFDEFAKVSAFIDKLIVSGETDFVLNNRLIIRFNCI